MKLKNGKGKKEFRNIISNIRELLIENNKIACKIDSLYYFA